MADVSRSTLVSVRRVVPSSEVTTETWEEGVPGSSSMVTVSSTTSWAPASWPLMSGYWGSAPVGQSRGWWFKVRGHCCGISWVFRKTFLQLWIIDEGIFEYLLILSTHKRVYSKGMTRAGTQCKDCLIQYIEWSQKQSVFNESLKKTHELGVNDEISLTVATSIPESTYWTKSMWHTVSVMSISKWKESLCNYVTRNLNEYHYCLGCSYNNTYTYDAYT